MAETFCDSGAVKLKAGANVSTSLTAANYTQLINQAEDYINVTTRKNYVDSFSGLNADVKLLLEDVASNHAAVSAIGYDMSGYTSRQEALIMINVLWAKMMEGIKLLKDKDNTAFIDGA